MSAAEVFDMDAIIDTAEKIEWLGSGYGGADQDGVFLGVAEGPVWVASGQYLVFTDNGHGVRYRYDESDGVTVLETNTFNANGQALDHEGRLVWCEHTGRRVRRREHDGSITIVADSYRGLKLNRPCDLAIDSTGAIWFSDPFTFGVDSETDLAGIYRVAPDLSRINLVVRDAVLPNGLTLSPDEHALYIADTARMHVRAFDIDYWGAEGGRPNPVTDRVVISMSGDEPGAPDGIKFDAAGRLWCTGPGGIWVIDPETGTHLGTVKVPDQSVTNFCFGGPDLTTLYFTTYTDMGRVQLRTAGLSIPRPAESTAAAAPSYLLHG